MPLAALIPAAISAGTAIYSASQARSASNKTLAAQNTATAQQLAAQQANLDRIQGLNQPFIDGGQGAYGALLAKFGIPPAGGARTSPPAAAGAPTGGGGYPGGGNAPMPAGGWGGDTFIDPRTGLSPGAGGPTGPALASGGAPAAPSGPAYPGAPYTTPGTPASGGGFDAAAYLQQNPDVAANAQERVAAGTAPNVEAVAAEHYQQFGQGEHRAQPMNPTTPGTPGEVVTPDLMNGTRPEAAPAPTFNRGPDQTIGDFGNAPDMASYFDPSKFTADPGYQFRVKEALGGVNANFAGRNALRSSGALKELSGRASDLASQEYNNWFSRQKQQYDAARGAYTQDRSYQTNLWDTKQTRDDTNFSNDRAYGTSVWDRNTARNDTNFNTDRSFQAGRDDQNTNNLFDLTNVGLRATGNVGNASTNNANAASDIFGNRADAAGNAATQGAAANTATANAIGNAAGNLFANWGGSTPSPVINNATNGFTSGLVSGFRRF